MSILKALQRVSNQLVAGFNHTANQMASEKRLVSAFRTRVELVILILDCSISMDDDDYPPSRLRAAIEAACEYVETLAGQGTSADVGVIAFDHEAHTILTPTAIASVKIITRAIRSICIRGGTDIAEGLSEAMDMLVQHKNRNTPCQIILLTDGHGGEPLNVADTLKGQYPLILDVIGIGGSRTEVNEALLKKVATTDANGVNHYRFIDDTRTLKQHYQQLATGLAWKGNHR